MDSISSSSLNFYGVGTNEFLGIVLSGNSQKDQLSGLAGWGYRYRVAIMGYHPDDTTLKDEEITYAICALGTCDGSGAGGRLRTPKISPGDVVLGKFLDGEKRQIPMITNVLGRTSGVKYGSGRFEVKSGFSEEIKPGGLGQQEYSQQDNVVSGTLKKQQPPKGDAGKNDEERKKETAALIEKQTGVKPEAAVGALEKARTDAVTNSPVPQRLSEQIRNSNPPMLQTGTSRTGNPTFTPPNGQLYNDKGYKWNGVGYYSPGQELHYADARTGGTKFDTPVPYTGKLYQEPASPTPTQVTTKPGDPLW